MAKKDKGTLYKEKMFQFIEGRDQMELKDLLALPGLRLLTKKQIIRRARTKRQRNARKIQRAHAK